MNDLSKTLKEFDKMLDKYPDETKYTYDFWTFIKGFLRIKTKTLPTAALMTVLKREKPQIFYALRKMSKTHPTLDILTHIEIEYEDALNQLNEFK